MKNSPTLFSTFSISKFKSFHVFFLSFSLLFFLFSSCCKYTKGKTIEFTFIDYEFQSMDSVLLVLVRGNGAIDSAYYNLQENHSILIDFLADREPEEISRIFIRNSQPIIAIDLDHFESEAFGLANTLSMCGTRYRYRFTLNGIQMPWLENHQLKFTP